MNEEIIKFYPESGQKVVSLVKNYVKNVSLKCGNSNSVHHEQIQEFKRYLGNIGIPYKVIDKYMNYHYGYARDGE